MIDPYSTCVICNIRTTEKHHEPPRSLLHSEDYNKFMGIDNPKYKHPMCREHHIVRESVGCRRFKELYPQYKGINITEYRQSKRR